MKNDELSLSIISMYYGLMGIDISKFNIEEIYIKSTYLSEISPFKCKHIIMPKDDLARELDMDINFFLERIFGREIHLSTKYNYNFEEEYISSVIKILNAISQIKVVNDKNKNYILEFQRLSYLLHISFSEINATVISMVKDLDKLLEEKNIEKIQKLINMCPNLSLLISLAMTMDKESHTMFYTDNSYKINFARIMKLLKHNNEVCPEFRTSSETYKRMTYENALKLTRTF